jgi:hypothetical protein
MTIKRKKEIHKKVNTVIFNTLKIIKLFMSPFSNIKDTYNYKFYRLYYSYYTKTLSEDECYEIIRQINWKNSTRIS